VRTPRANPDGERRGDAVYDNCLASGKWSIIALQKRTAPVRAIGVSGVQLFDLIWTLWPRPDGTARDRPTKETHQFRPARTAFRTDVSDPASSPVPNTRWPDRALSPCSSLRAYPSCRVEGLSLAADVLFKAFPAGRGLSGSPRSASRPHAVLRRWYERNGNLIRGHSCAGQPSPGRILRRTALRIPARHSTM
jgi:hypothetical protein